MRDEYDFSGSRPNPYAERVRRPVTVNIDVETIDYFKDCLLYTSDAADEL